MRSQAPQDTAVAGGGLEQGSARPGLLLLRAGVAGFKSRGGAHRAQDYVQRGHARER